MSRKIVLAAGGSRRYRKSDALKLAEQVHNVIIKYLTEKEENLQQFSTMSGFVFSGTVC